MGSAFVMAFVDGLESFLVVGVAVAFLRKTRQPALVRAIRWGVVAAIVISPVAAIWLARLDDQAWWEGRLALVGAIAFVWLAWYMWRRRRLLRTAPAELSPTAHAEAWIALFVFTVVAITREGIHTIFLITTFVLQVPIAELRLAVVAGIAVAVLVSWLWARYGHRVHREAFAVVTAVVLVLATVQLVSQAVRQIAHGQASPTVGVETELVSPQPRAILGQ